MTESQATVDELTQIAKQYFPHLPNFSGHHEPSVFLLFLPWDIQSTELDNVNSNTRLKQCILLLPSLPENVTLNSQQ